VETLAAMIGINPSPSSQFVPAYLHKTQRVGGVSGDGRRIRSGLGGIKVPHLALD